MKLILKTFFVEYSMSLHNGIDHQPPGLTEACVREYVHSLADAVMQNDSKQANKKARYASL